MEEKIKDGCCEGCAAGLGCNCDERTVQQICNRKSSGTGRSCCDECNEKGGCVCKQCKACCSKR